MIQVYRDNEEGTVDHHTTSLAHPQPRWAKKSQHPRHKRLLIASGALATLYLFFCAWFAYAQWENLAADDEVDGFPHWPFPKHPPHPPHRPKHPHHHPPFFPHPTVLACVPVPTPSSDLTALESVELNVTLPHHKAVVLHDHLLHGNVSVVKTPHHCANVTEEMMFGNKTLEVAITVANRTHWHPHPPKSVIGGEEKEEKEFLLCAITFGPPHHPKTTPAPGEELEDEEKPRPPHPPPFHPHPVIVTILPAHNSTHPKLPGHRCPHHPPSPPGGPDEEEKEDEETPVSLSVFRNAYKSTLSFLFPMLSISSPYRPPRFPHHPHHPPPPPPFKVTSLTVSVPQFVPVKYGLPFRPPFHRRRH